MESKPAGTVKDKPRSTLDLLQTLRAIAAGMVVAYHIYLWRGKYLPHSDLLPRGTVACEAGVDLFFVISGFIMMHITPKAHRSVFDQLSFLFRRFARIYPAYWAVAVPLLFIWLWRPTLFNTYAGHRVDVISSLLLCPGSGPQIIFVAWTLVCELSFYVIASFIFYLAAAMRLWAVGLWAATILVANLIHPASFANPWVSTLLHPLTLEFIAGMTLAYFFNRGIGPLRSWVAAPVVVICFGLILASGAVRGSYFSSPEQLSRPLFYGVPALVIVWMMIQMNLQGEWRWLAALAPLGDRSYSTYLVHLPVVAVVYRLASGPLARTGEPAVPLIAILVLLALVIPVESLYRLVEKPSHHLARRISSRLGAQKTL